MLSGHCLSCHSNLQLINSSYWCCHIPEFHEFRPLNNKVKRANTENGMGLYRQGLKPMTSRQGRCECLARAIRFQGLDNKQEVSREVSSDNKKDVKSNEELPKSLIAIKHLRNTLESPSFLTKVHSRL